MGKAELEKVREDCGSWGEEFGCLEGFPSDCPYYEECSKEAEESED